MSQICEPNGDVVQFIAKDINITLRTSIVPPAGSWVNISGVDYRVGSSAFAIDYAEPYKRMRCIVELTKASGAK